MKKAWALFLIGGIISFSAWGKDVEILMRQKAESYMAQSQGIEWQVNNEFVVAAFADNAFAVIKESQNRFEWWLLPQYYYEDEPDTSGYVTGLNLSYTPIAEVFAILPANYGLWLEQPYYSLAGYVDVFIQSAKAMSGISYQELENAAATRYNGIPGWDVIFKFKSGANYYVWKSHLLWREDIGYNIFYLTTSAAYNNSLYRAYFDAVLILANFDVRTSLAHLLPTPSPRILLGQNYPNPFNAQTMIPFSISERSWINLRLYNAIGQMIREIVDGIYEPGNYSIQVAGGDLTSGTYIFLLNQKNGRQEIIKAAIIK